jgi:hypothetical protein
MRFERVASALPDRRTLVAMRFLLALALIVAPFTAAETIIVESQPECSEEVPQSVWDNPLCSDFELDEVLLAAIERGDRSALQLALQRYRGAPTWAQKVRLAPVLLHDAAIWNEMYGLAQKALDFEADQQAWYLALDAWEVVCTDPRARALMRQGLETEAPNVVAVAMYGLAFQRDVSALPLIDRTLHRMPDDAYWMVMALEGYDSDAARRVTAKYRRDDDE